MVWAICRPLRSSSSLHRWCRWSRLSSQALGIFLPLITTNCAVLGVAILVIQKDFNLLQSVVYAFSTAIGFGLAMTVFAGIREQLELTKVPKGMQGMAIVLVSAGLLSLAFMGFSGVDGGLRTLFGLD